MNKSEAGRIFALLLIATAIHYDLFMVNGRRENEICSVCNKLKQDHDVQMWKRMQLFD
jgi:hypothetical protein